MTSCAHLDVGLGLVRHLHHELGRVLAGLEHQVEDAGVHGGAQVVYV